MTAPPQDATLVVARAIHATPGSVPAPGSRSAGSRAPGAAPAGATDASRSADASSAGAARAAMLVEHGVVVWRGTVRDGRARAPHATVVDLGDATVTPAFVDAHVHATSAGLLLTGLDLTRCASLGECLDVIARFAATSDAPLLWGHGWDETRWPERRPPTRAELDAAVGGRRAYLSRVDVHSALASTPLAATVRADEAGFSPDGPLSQDAHHTVRQAALDSLTREQRRAAQRAFLDHAAAHGVGSAHECGGPIISAVDDLADLVGHVAPAHGVEVVPYWGEPATSAEHARELLRATGAHGLAGDLFCDGAVGSRTAATCAPYADAAHTSGAAYLDADAIARHVVACTEAGVQAGFHVIGDAAMAAVVDGLTRAAADVGEAALRARRHRLEHAEMVTAEQAAVLARHGVVASVQPVFDALWGGADGMYAARLGATRAAAMNPFRMLADAGVALAFGSDAPVTAGGPWAAVRAAVAHRTPGAGVGFAEALAAHTTGGHDAAGPAWAARVAARHARHPEPPGHGGTPAGTATPAGPGSTARPMPPTAPPGPTGTLAPGAPATYAVWDSADLAADVLAGRDPRCLRTVVSGRTVHDVLSDLEGAPS